MTENINKQEELKSWVREQFQGANKHLAQQGILFETVLTEECRYLFPDIAVWKIRDTNKILYWVIGGEVPADAVPASVASNAREAIKHFSLHWQMKAENIRNHHQSDKTQLDYAMLLTQKAELLYKVQEDDHWWKNEK